GPQDGHGLEFPVHEIGARWWTREAPQPAEDLVVIGMRRHLIVSEDARAHGHDLAVNLHEAGALDELTPARARCLEADEEHGVARVGEKALEVVQHAAAGGHAAGRDDDGGTV